MSVVAGARSYSASSFLDSIGINTHIPSTKDAYGNVSLIKSSLDYLGIDTVRDVITTNAATVSTYQSLAEGGIKFDFLLPSLTSFGTEAQLLYRLQQIDKFNDLNPGSVVAVEGPNEVDNWTVSYEGKVGAQAAFEIQKDLYAFINADASLSGVSVYGYTLGSAVANGQTQSGSLSQYTDAANLHLYTGTDATPGVSIDKYIDTLTKSGAAGDIVITETGFTTVYPRAYSGVDETTQANYTLMAMVESFSAGVDMTYLYELFDSASDASGTNTELHFGLFNADGTPKLAAVAVHNLMSILADDGKGTVAPGKLALAIGDASSTVETLMLDKSDGSTAVIVWPDVRSWNGVTNEAMSVAKDTVTIYFNEKYDQVSVYDPITGETAIYKANGADRVVLTLTDHPVVVELSAGFAPSDGVYSGTGAELAVRIEALEHASVLTSITITDGHYLPVESVAAMREFMADNPKALAAIKGEYGFSVSTADPTVLRTSFYDASGTLERTESDYLTSGKITLTIVNNADGSSETTHLDGSGNPTSKTLVHVDHSREEFKYGITGKDYVSTEETYDAAGRSTGVAYSRADGSISEAWNRTADGTLTDLRYGPDGKLVSSYVQSADGSVHMTTYVNGVAKTENATLADGSNVTVSFTNGVATVKTIVHADKTKEVYKYEITGKEYVSTKETYDAQGRVTTVDYTRADGTASEAWSKSADGTVTDLRYGLDGKLVSSYVQSADGSIDMTNYVKGLPKSENITLADGSKHSIAFNDAGVKTTESVLYANGTRENYEYGIKGKSYVTQITVFNQAGKLVSTERLHADGTHDYSQFVDADGATWTYTFNAAGQPTRVTQALSSGAYDTVTYGADGAKVSESVVRADRSHDEYVFNVKGQAYTTRVESYDASGKSVKVVYLRADGTQQHTWTRADDGTIVDKLYDASGNVTSIYTKTAAGKETYVTVKAGSTASVAASLLVAAPLLSDLDPLHRFAAGTDGDDRLAGTTAADTMIGGRGDDIYTVNNAKDQVLENGAAGTDTVNSSISYTLGDFVENLTLTGSANINATGNALANVLIGNSGANVLDGGLGADRMSGGAGNDTYVVDNVKDVVTELTNGGTDTVMSSVSYTLGDNVENLTLTGSANINATGNALANVLTGNAGANVLDGGLGADTMIGGAGNDTYIVDNAKDVVTELANGGTDTVMSSITYKLGDNVENLTLTGAANINATGNALANVLTGNSGANVLDGGAGADTMAGGAGNDTYIVDNANDVVTELANGGTDVVNSAVTYKLGDFLENLTLTGTAGINGTGNSLANAIVGNAGANIIDGGAGADRLTGGAGKDTFVFSTALGASNVDVITDFKAVDDTMNLDDAVFTGLAKGQLAASAFYVGAAAHDADDRIIYNAATGSLLFDRDGTGTKYAAVQFATLENHAALTNADFTIV
jgi:hypothetical protein